MAKRAGRRHHPSTAKLLEGAMCVENHAIVSRLFDEVVNAGKLPVADELVAAQLVDHTHPSGVAPGREGLKQMISMVRAAFPDLQVAVEEQIADGDKVVVRWTAHGTHEGALLGLNPTGKPVTLTGIDIFRLVDGRIVERWAEGGIRAMMEHVSTAPAPAAPA